MTSVLYKAVSAELEVWAAAFVEDSSKKLMVSYPIIRTAQEEASSGYEATELMWFHSGMTYTSLFKRCYLIYALALNSTIAFMRKIALYKIKSKGLMPTMICFDLGNAERHAIYSWAIKLRYQFLDNSTHDLFNFCKALLLFWGNFDRPGIAAQRAKWECIVQKHKQKNKGFISDEIEICNRETGVQSGRGSKSGLDGMMLSQIWHPTSTHDR